MATNVVASYPTERRLTGKSITSANIIQVMIFTDIPKLIPIILIFCLALDVAIFFSEGNLSLG